MLTEKASKTALKTQPLLMILQYWFQWGGGGGGREHVYSGGWGGGGGGVKYSFLKLRWPWKWVGLYGIIS